MVRAFACDSKGRDFNSWPNRCQVMTLGKLFSHVLLSVNKQYNLVPVTGQRCPATEKATVGLASHWPCVTHRFIHLRAQGLSKADEHPTNTPRGVWYSLPFKS